MCRLGAIKKRAKQKSNTAMDREEHKKSLDFIYMIAPKLTENKLYEFVYIFDKQYDERFVSLY